MRNILTLLAVLALAVTATAAEKPKNHDLKAHDCTKCHTLKPAEAATLLSNAIPNAKILNIRNAPAKGLWEVFLQAEAGKGIIYIDYSKKHFFSGAVIDIKQRKNLTSERFNELNKIDISTIPLEDALIMGDKAAKNRVIVFSDPDCSFCAKLHEEMKKVIEKRKDIVFFIKLFPLPMHPDAAWKSKAMVCKNSLQMLEDNFAGKPVEKADCPTTAIDDNIKLASDLGITGTPALILKNGTVIPGYKEADALINLITNAK